MIAVLITVRPSVGEPTVTPARQKHPLTVQRRAAIVAGIAVIGYVAWLSVQAPSAPVLALLALWGLGIALVFYGFVSAVALRDWLKRLAHSLRVGWREWTLLAGLLGIALIVRGVGLDTFPAVMVDDEGYYANAAAQHYMPVSFPDYYLNSTSIRPEWNWNPFGYEWGPTIDLISVPQAVSIALSGNTLGAVRWPSAILGALTIPAVYLLARRLFDRRVALLAAVFLMLLPVHIQFSRLALNQVMDPLFGALLFAFLVQALRTGDKVEYGLTGVMLGFSQYGATPARMLPFLILVVVGWFYLNHRDRLREHLPLLVTPCTIGLVMVLPQLYFLVSNQLAVVPRLGQIGFWHFLPQDGSVGHFLYGQVRNSFLAYAQVPDHGVFYGYYDPLLGWIAPILLFIGL
ncbi:MAG TPA: glycosyltransferase family 39 protein, partial [Aggregatilineaceae bacterium]|nr:glycosyltransferase family 39 protein [Aggregatilineaceae bacterium]